MSNFKTQYPAQSGAYKIRIKEGTGWREYDTVRLEISVGQPYHEGEKLRSKIEWARARFQDVNVLVNDTLQRFNLMYERGMSEKQATKETRLQGDEWLVRNGEALAGCSCYRWDHWKNHEDFSSTLWKAEMFYRNNAGFHDAVENAIYEVWDRRAGQEGYEHNRKDDFFNVSREYLLEETAGLALAYKALPGISAYPGTFQKMWAMFVGKRIEGAPEGLENAHCIRIDFSRRKTA